MREAKTIMICDRCGKEQEETFSNTATISIEYRDDTESKDLCIDCLNVLLKALESPIVEKPQATDSNTGEPKTCITIMNYKEGTVDLREQD